MSAYPWLQAAEAGAAGRGKRQRKDVIYRESMDWESDKESPTEKSAFFRVLLLQDIVFCSSAVDKETTTCIGLPYMQQYPALYGTSYCLNRLKIHASPYRCIQMHIPSRY